MTASLTIHGLDAGILRGRLDGADSLSLAIGTAPPGPVALSADTTGWSFAIALPPDALNDGVTVLSLSAPGAEARYVLAAGHPVSGDAAVEIADLRAELALLKRAFLEFAAEPPLRAAERALLLAEARQTAAALLTETREREGS